MQLLPIDKEVIDKEVTKEDEVGGDLEAGIDKGETDEVGIGRETDRGTTLGGMDLYNSLA